MAAESCRNETISLLQSYIPLYERREREVTIGTALPSVLTHNSSEQEPANLCHRGRERGIPRTGVEDPAEQSGIIGAFAAHRTGKLDCIYLFSIF